MSFAFGRRGARRTLIPPASDAEMPAASTTADRPVVTEVSATGIRHVVVTRQAADGRSGAPPAMFDKAAASSVDVPAGERVASGVGLGPAAPGLAVLAVTGVAVVCFALSFGPPISLIVVAFVLTCPGIALLRLVRLSEPLLELVAGVALSTALVGLLTVGQLYLGRWSPGASFLILAIVTGTAALADPAVLPRSVKGAISARSTTASRSTATLLGAVDGAIHRSWQSMIAGIEARRRGRLLATEGGGSDGRSDDGRKAVRDLPPPPLAVVRDHQPTPPGQPRKAGRRSTFGWDPLDRPTTTKTLRTTIEKVVDDLADEKEERTR
jgi:hypothetical protein